MARLESFPWWPTTWGVQSGHAPTPAEISRDGVLKNVRLLDDKLSLVVDYTGVICTATVMPNLSQDAVILLRHILLQHVGQPMEVVEKIDIDFSGSFPFIR
jgi:hypothetical protein